MVKWFFNSNMGTAIFVATFSFLASGTWWLINVENRLSSIEDSHINFHFPDNDCIMVEYKDEYFCLKKEIE